MYFLVYSGEYRYLSRRVCYDTRFELQIIIMWYLTPFFFVSRAYIVVVVYTMVYMFWVLVKIAFMYSQKE